MVCRHARSLWLLSFAVPRATACQSATAGPFLDYDALIVPSARADGSNVVIFVNELAGEATFERVGVEQIV